MELGQIIMAKVVLGTLAGVIGLGFFAAGRSLSAMLVGLSLLLLSAVVLFESSR
ncbi:MAG: hypothetical protein IT561_19830 [Alphaproteobacteria bacterium]|nr:hypothetical protein [Alphaproteobacteria bacterium]